MHRPQFIIKIYTCHFFKFVLLCFFFFVFFFSVVRAGAKHPIQRSASESIYNVFDFFSLKAQTNRFLHIVYLIRATYAYCETGFDPQYIFNQKTLIYHGLSNFSQKKLLFHISSFLLFAIQRSSFAVRMRCVCHFSVKSVESMEFVLARIFLQLVKNSLHCHRVIHT